MLASSRLKDLAKSRAALSVFPLAMAFHHVTTDSPLNVHTTFENIRGTKFALNPRRRCFHLANETAHVVFNRIRSAPEKGAPYNIVAVEDHRLRGTPAGFAAGTLRETEMMDWTGHFQLALTCPGGAGHEMLDNLTSPHVCLRRRQRLSASSSLKRNSKGRTSLLAHSLYRFINATWRTRVYITIHLI